VLELTGPRPVWQGAAHDGVLTLPSGERHPVTVLLGPRTAAADALARARKASRVALTLRHPGVVRLVQVVEFQGRIAWCYERVDGIGLVHVISREDAGGLSARAAAELVAQVAEVLLALGGPGLHHPGPEPSDLLLQADGHVRILGFAGPFPPDPSMRPPHPDQVEPGAVYRLGVLLAALLGGTTPAPATDASAHEVLIRRALIRAMSRPGPVLSDRYGQWIRHMLAWAPAERPPLSAVPAGLRSVGWATGGQGLTEWSQSAVPELGASVSTHARSTPDLSPLDDTSDPGVLRALAEPGPPPPRPRPDRTATPTPVSQTPTGGYATVESDLFVERSDDEDTQEATWDPEEGFAATRGGRPRGRSESIPVDIGPPAVAVKKRPPTLPPGFLEGEEDAEDDDSDTGVAKVVGPQPGGLFSDVDRRVALWWGGAVGGLLVLAVLFILYLASGPPPSPTDAPRPEPSLRDAIAPGPVDADPSVRPDVQVPAPDVFAGDTDAVVDDSDTDAQTTDTERPPRRANEVSVLFRVASGQRAKLHVSCDSARTSKGWDTLRMSLPRGDRCIVAAKAPDGRLLKVSVDIQDFATVDCFHAWAEECIY